MPPTATKLFRAMLPNVSFNVPNSSLGNAMAMAEGGDWFEASLMLKITYVFEAVWWYVLGGHRAHLS